MSLAAQHVAPCPAVDHSGFGGGLVFDSTFHQKTYWGVGEVVMWVRTRDYERLAALSELSEPEAMVQSMFTFAAPLDPYSLWRFSKMNPDANCDVATTPDSNQSARIEGPVLMPADIALSNVQTKVRSGRLRLTAIKCDGRGEERTPVPSDELNDLAFRFTPDDPVAPVGLWSRSRSTLARRSPQFLRADVTRAWPGRNTKTATVTGTIRRRLHEIMLPEAPLTKFEAQQRCIAEVANAYPAAFEKAWAELDPSLKRGRGKHGPRIH
jgi:hypothetical protein